MGLISEATVAKRIKENTNGKQEYVSGYSTPIKYARVRVRCTVCGETWETSYHNLTTQYRGCALCREKKRSKTEKEKREEAERKLEERRRRREQRIAEKERRRSEREIPHYCPVCGGLTTRPKYCSGKCMKKANWSTKEAKRREKITAAMVDKDITVRGLYRRDAGVCHICGGRCNPEDYTVRGGAFIAGDWYPSIDHVVPLAKGGSHSWDNVKLAHRRCNTLKRDNLAVQYLPRGTILRG